MLPSPAAALRFSDQTQGHDKADHDLIFKLEGGGSALYEIHSEIF